MPKAGKDGHPLIQRKKVDLYRLSILEKHSLYRDIIASPPFQRLKRIRFLGAIDYFYAHLRQSNISSTSRYDHTISVAFLALQACRLVGLPERTEKEIVTAALLHDIGHGPLSHSVEPFFYGLYGIGHKEVGESLILGDLFVGNELPELLMDHEVLPQAIVERLSEKNCNIEYGFFNSPLNVDTIDGMARTSLFFEAGLPWQIDDTEKLLRLAVLGETEFTVHGDCFWSLKNRMYNTYIYNPKWRVYDHLLSLILDNARNCVLPHDFLLDDQEFEDKFRGVITNTVDMFVSRRIELDYLLHIRFGSNKLRAKRDFSIDKEVSILRPEDAQRRYLQRRETNDVQESGECEPLQNLHS